MEGQGKQAYINVHVQYTNREDVNTSSQYQQNQKEGNNIAWNTKNKETPSNLIKNGRLRRGKLTGQFNIALTYQNLLRKHCSSSRLNT